MSPGLNIPGPRIPEMPKAPSLEELRNVFRKSLAGKFGVIQTLLERHPDNPHVQNLAFQNALMQGRLMENGGAEQLIKPEVQARLTKLHNDAVESMGEIPLEKGEKDPLISKRLQAMNAIRKMATVDESTAKNFNLAKLVNAASQELLELFTIESIPGIGEHPAIQQEKAFLTAILDQYNLPSGKDFIMAYTPEGRERVTDRTYTGPMDDLKMAGRVVLGLVASGLAVMTYLMARKMNKDNPDTKATMFYAAIAGLSVMGLKPFFGSRADAVKDELMILQHPPFATYAKLNGENLVNVMETLFQNRGPATRHLTTLMLPEDKDPRTAKKKIDAGNALKEMMLGAAKTDVERRFVTNAIDNDAANFVPFARAVLLNITSDAAKFSLYALMGKELPDPAGGATPIV